MEELIARVFAARSFAHERHLLTYSFAEHAALEGFYTAIVDKADELAEVYQGMFGPMIPFPAVKLSGTDAASVLRLEANWIKGKRAELSKGEETIGALIDELAAVYFQTLDRLRRK